jgi:hypothetical protein
MRLAPALSPAGHLPSATDISSVLILVSGSIAKQLAISHRSTVGIFFPSLYGRDVEGTLRTRRSSSTPSAHMSEVGVMKHACPLPEAGSPPSPATLPSLSGAPYPAVPPLKSCILVTPAGMIELTPKSEMTMLPLESMRRLGAFTSLQWKEGREEGGI